MTMITQSFRCMIALAVLALGVSFAADIDGKWTGQIQGRRGQQTETLMLKASDSTLTGTIQGRGKPFEITNGKIDGNTVSFNVIREFGGNKITEEYKGTISGSELKLTFSRGRGGPVQVTYKKE